MLASVGSWGRVGGAALALGVLVVGVEGCTVDVSLGFQTCEYQGNTYDVGETFQEDCNTCQCQEDGTVGCTAMACGTTCDYGGVTYQSGDTFDAGDGCNSCTCMDDGTVACTEMVCVVCEEPAPDCLQPGSPNCFAELVCDPTLGWQCVITCDECMGGPPPCPAPPPGCTSLGPTCVDGNWDCGPYECDLGCYYAGGVYQPGETFPDVDGCNTCTCLADGSVACTDQACPVCMTTPPSCQVPDPSCTAYPVCLDGTNWECKIDCLPSFCTDPEPICPLGPPNCSYSPRCTDMGWVCDEYCLPACPDPMPICDAAPPCTATTVCGPMGWECQVACPAD